LLLNGRNISNGFRNRDLLFCVLNILGNRLECRWLRFIPNVLLLLVGGLLGLLGLSQEVLDGLGLIVSLLGLILSLLGLVLSLGLRSVLCLELDVLLLLELLLRLSLELDILLLLELLLLLVLLRLILLLLVLWLVEGLLGDWLVLGDWSGDVDVLAVVVDLVTRHFRTFVHARAGHRQHN